MPPSTTEDADLPWPGAARKGKKKKRKKLCERAPPADSRPAFHAPQRHFRAVKRLRPSRTKQMYLPGAERCSRRGRPLARFSVRSEVLRRFRAARVPLHCRYLGSIGRRRPIDPAQWADGAVPPALEHRGFDDVARLPGASTINLGTSIGTEPLTRRAKRRRVSIRKTARVNITSTDFTSIWPTAAPPYVVCLPACRPADHHS